METRPGWTQSLEKKKNSAADALFLSLFDASLRRSARSRVFAKVPELAEAKNKGGGPPHPQPPPPPPLSLPAEEDFAEVTCLVLVAACESSCIPLPRFISPDPDSSGAAMGTMCVGIWILLVALHIQGKISDHPPAHALAHTSSLQQGLILCLYVITHFERCFFAASRQRFARDAWMRLGLCVLGARIYQTRESSQSSNKNGCRILIRLHTHTHRGGKKLMNFPLLRAGGGIREACRAPARLPSFFFFANISF